MMLLSVFYVFRSTNQWHVLPSETFPFTKVSLQVAFCRELGGGDLVADLFTNLHKVTKCKNNNNTSMIQH